MSNQAIWLTIGFSSVVMLLMRLFGYFLPSEIINRDRLLRIIGLIPVVLLAALVAIQTMTVDSVVMIDHRLAGVSAGAIALYLKRSFITVMVIAGLTGAIVYNYFG